MDTRAAGSAIRSSQPNACFSQAPKSLSPCPITLKGFLYGSAWQRGSQTQADPSSLTPYVCPSSWTITWRSLRPFSQMPGGKYEPPQGHDSRWGIAIPIVV